MNQEFEIGIVGGSLGGLQLAFELQKRSIPFDIFERSSKMDDRGAGIVLKPDFADYLQINGILSLPSAACPFKERVFIDESGHREFVPADSLATSWQNLFDGYKQKISTLKYHCLKELIAFSQDRKKVKLEFADGTVLFKDLVVFADGGNSMARRNLCPLQPLEYSGHIAWRGLVEAQELRSPLKEELQQRCTIFHRTHSHFLVYEILKGKERFFNWVWYQRVPGKDLPFLLVDRNGIQREFSLPAGLVPPETDSQLKIQARSFLSKECAELVQLTQSPFVQPIYDVVIDQMNFGKVGLLGDAACLARPHATASTYKSFIDAKVLSEKLELYRSEPWKAFDAYNEEQVPFGKKWVQAGRAMGNLDCYIRPGS
jgi:2-polyprenyl-6-methoxyphenol hydroxylase-like FAD-dependent oxidoreductase